MAITITTTGDTFEPVIALIPGSVASVTWSCPGFGDETGLTPTFAFGSTATRTVTMTVTGGGGDADIRMLNCGYDPDFDVGDFMPPSGLAKDPESISGFGSINNLTGLVYLLADDTDLTGALNLTGMSQLQYIQLAHTNVTGLTLTGCTSLIRLQAEACDLTTIDLNPVTGTLRDLRTAIQQGGTLTFTPVTGTMTQLYHYCVRDQTLVNSIPLTQMPALTEYWTWNCGLTGSLNAPGQTLLRDVRSFGNYWTAVDFTGCTGLRHVDLNFCWLNSVQVDGVLAALDATGADDGYVDLSVNTAPTSTAVADELTGRGWDVTIDDPTDGTITIEQTVADYSGSFPSPPGAGNSIIVIVCAANTAGNPISTSAPTFAGSPVPTAVLLQEELVTAPGQACYHAMWLMPHVGNGGNGFAIAIDFGGGFLLGAYALEVSGLGVTPQVDKQASDSHATSTAIASGATGLTGAAVTLVLGAAQTYAGSSSGPGGAWTLLDPGANGWIGYQLPTVAGSYSWSQTADGSAPWTCGVVALASFVPPQIGFWGIPI